MRKSMVVYSSRSGDTKKVAEAIFDILPGKKEIYTVQEAPPAEKYDFIAMGFGVEKGRPDPVGGGLYEDPANAGERDGRDFRHTGGGTRHRIRPRMHPRGRGAGFGRTGGGYIPVQTPGRAVCHGYDEGGPIRSTYLVRRENCVCPSFSNACRRIAYDRWPDVFPRNRPATRIGGEGMGEMAEAENGGLAKGLGFNIGHFQELSSMQSSFRAKRHMTQASIRQLDSVFSGNFPTGTFSVDPESRLPKLEPSSGEAWARRNLPHSVGF